ncbi:MAG TPA: hypothetical protein VHF47_06555 [Acidimicrobiales bacterium]|nr:hypothetical protein [Acidimicrobiales bacterium]
MLDHAFLDVIAAVRATLERSLLERRLAEDSLTMDLLLGDLAWETTYALPGEGEAPHITAEITLGWSTWSQTAFRNQVTGLEDEEPPAVDVEVVLAVRDLAHRPDPSRVAEAVGTGPAMGDDPFGEAAPVVEEHAGRFAVTVERVGSVFLEEDALKTADDLQAVFEPLGPWLASALVRLADLGFEFLPPEDDDEGG